MSKAQEVATIVCTNELINALDRFFGQFGSNKDWEHDSYRNAKPITRKDVKEIREAYEALKKARRAK